MRILIADDEETSRKILERTLSSAGHLVLPVEDGIKALASIEKEVPDMLISDWMMPDLDGLELCRRVRALNLPNYVYIILWTALTQKENIIQGLDAGADDYITKPFDRTELLARVRAGERIIKLERSLCERNRELSEALAQVKQLKGLLPICMFCKKIRDDENYWQQIEDYIAQHSGAEFSHGVCPECYEKHSPRYSKGQKSQAGSANPGSALDR